MRTCFQQMISRRLFIGALMAGSLMAAAPASALTVTVKGLSNTRGEVVVCLWRADDEGFPNCAEGEPWKQQKTRADTPKVTFTDLPPGSYAVSMFHDEKGLGKPETNFVGMPTSAIGLANNPDIGPLNPPTFEKGKVVVPDVDTIEITAKYVF